MNHDPNRVALAGDWHGNTGWACHVVEEAAKLLADEYRPTIIHAGDFGIWPGAAGRDYLTELGRALAAYDVEVWFVDGNHEWHPELKALCDEERSNGGQGLVPIDDEILSNAYIKWIPRGHRWQWHGKTWMGLGGAVSVDAAVRTKGRSWWPEETITGEQFTHATRPGKVHVMLTHDAPSAVRMSFGQPPSFWDVMDLARADAHRESLQDAVDKIQPEVLIHGHYHRPVRQTIEPYGTQVIGLDMDGADGNFTLFDTRELKEIP